MNPEKRGVLKYETLSAEEKELINKAVQELVVNKIISGDDEALQREIRYQISEIEPGKSEELKSALKGEDGKPIIARRDQKEKVEGGGIGVTLVYGGAERAEGVNV